MNRCLFLADTFNHTNFSSKGLTLKPLRATGILFLLTRLHPWIKHEGRENKENYQQNDLCFCIVMPSLSAIWNAS